VSQVAVTDADIRAYYDMNPARFPKPPEVKPADPKTPAKPSNPDADFAAVKQQVEAALVLERAQKLALKAASDLAVAIFESKAVDSAAVDGLLASRKLQQKRLQPFTREAGPAELDHSPEIANEAFKLNKEHFVSDALPSRTGAVVLFWKDLQPAHNPLFAEVREKVAADYIQDAKQKRFIELGKTLRAQIEARLKAGDSFEKAAANAASAAGIKVETKTLAPFSMRTRPQDVDYTILGALDRLNKGEVSEMLTTPGYEKGIFVYAADKKLPNLSETNPEYVEMRNQIAALSARVTAGAYLSELIEREQKKSEPKPE
jgi:peptidyl-prolyl cis-trans isomerase D